MRRPHENPLISMAYRRVGDPSRNRTRNLRIRSPPLYPVELRGRLGARELGAERSMRPGRAALGGEIVAIAVLAQHMRA